MFVVRQKSWARLRERSPKFCFWSLRSLCDFGKVILPPNVSFLTCKMKQFDRLISFQSNHFVLFKRNPILKYIHLCFKLVTFQVYIREYTPQYICSFQAILKITFHFLNYRTVRLNGRKNSSNQRISTSITKNPWWNNQFFLVSSQVKFTQVGKTGKIPEKDL